MPKIFLKDTKFTIIEYGENCSSFPLWDDLKQKVKTIIAYNS